MAIVETFTSDPNYKLGLDITYEYNTVLNTHTRVTLIPYLKSTVGVTRKQHNWTIQYALDATEIDARFNGYLPDDTSAAGVNSAGKLYMEKNKWYQWGPARSVLVKNDGNKHSFGIYLLCHGTTPSYCPEAGRFFYGHTIQLAKYTGPAPAINNLKVSFDETTRLLSYSWDATACDYITIWNNLYDSLDETAKPVTTGWVDGGKSKLNISDSPVTREIPDNIVKINYEVRTYFNNGLFHSTPGSLTVPEGNRVYFKNGGVWKKATPYIKTKDGWKKVTKVYVRTADGWKGV